MAAHHILVAIDFEQGSELALARAVELASARPDTDVIALHVFLPYLGYEFVPDDKHQSLKMLEKATRHALELFQARSPGARLPSARVEVAIGTPAAEIVWVAAHFDAECVVLGSHGRKGFSRLWLGSVAERVVRLAGCPVFVCRDKDHDLSAKVPEIEPLCPACAETRERTAGKELWCARHSEHHITGHISVPDGGGPSAWSSMTGQ